VQLYYHGKIEILRGKNPVPGPPFPTRISHELVWYWTLACGDRPATLVARHIVI